MNDNSNLHQAAVILKSLPKPQAAKILARLEAADMKTVLNAIELLDQVTADQIAESLERLNQETQQYQFESDDGLEVDDLLEVTRQIQEKNAVESDGSQNHPFQFLIDALPMVRDRLLRDEHPKNIAMVLSMLPPEVASACMKSLDPVGRVTILRRLCEIEELDPDQVGQLSYTLKLRHKKLMSKQQYRKSGLDSAAAMLSCADPDTQEALISMMNQSDPELADTLERSVLKIEDLQTLDDRELKTLMRNVDTSCWAPAIKQASASLQSKILRSMAIHPATLLNQEMTQIGSIDRHVERLAQRQIINTAMQLHHEGKIRFRLSGGKTGSSIMPTQSSNALDMLAQPSLPTSPIN